MIFVDSQPAPKGSVDVNAAGRGVRHTDRSVRFHDQIVERIRRELTIVVDGVQMRPEPYDGPVSVLADFVLRPPKSDPPPWPVRAIDGDLDKLQRALGDALQDAKLITDDRNIVAWSAGKRYAVEGERVGVHLLVQAMPSPAPCLLCGGDAVGHDLQMCAEKTAAWQPFGLDPFISSTTGGHIEMSGHAGI